MKERGVERKEKEMEGEKLERITGKLLILEKEKEGKEKLDQKM